MITKSGMNFFVSRSLIASSGLETDFTLNSNEEQVSVKISNEIALSSTIKTLRFLRILGNIQYHKS